ncbi:MAG: D-2-hydroxyacid dehydrogenase [Pseudomonadota bacterium]
MTTVLMIHHQPDDIRGIVEARFPDVTVGYAAKPDEIGAQLEALKPEAVFSIQDASLPGKYHHQAVTAPSVKWVQVGGSGYEQMQPFDPEKIVLTNSAGVIARHLAQTVTGAMIALNGHFFRYRAQQQAHDWAPIRFRPMAGQTLLVVGLGQIGDWVAKNAKALGMTVHAVRRRQEPVDHVDQLFAPDDLMTALGDADVVSVHVRANNETRHMFNDAAFAAMMPGSFFLNTARGMVCDTQALIAALDRGHVAGAYLDVFEEEPLPTSHPLWDRDDVFMMPHSSDNIVGWETAFTEFFADNLERWRAGMPLVNTIQG